MVLFAALLSISCVYSPTIEFGIIDSKIVWFLFIISLILIYLAINYIANEIHLNINTIDKTIYLWFAYLILNNYIHKANLESIKVLQTIGLSITYFYIKELFTDKKGFTPNITIFILSLTFIQILVAVLQWFNFIPSFNPNFRFTGLFFNPSPFSIYLSSLLVFCLSIYFYHINKIIKTAGFILFLTGIPIIIIAQSRSAWLGLLSALALILYLKFWDVRKYYKKRVPKTLAFLVIIIVGGGPYYLYHLKKDSADGRLLTWKLSLKMLYNHPYIGFGPGGFEGSFLKYQSLYYQIYPERMNKEGRLAGQVVYAFNDMLQISVEQGILGFILFIIIIINYVRYSNIILKFHFLKNKRQACIVVGAMGSILLILISGLFSYPMTVLPIQIFMYTCLAIVSACYSNGLIDEVVASHRIALTLNIKKSVIFTIYLISGACFLSYTIDTYKGYTLGFNIKKNGYNGNSISEIYSLKYIFQQEPWFILMKCEYLLKQNKLDEAIDELEGAKSFTSDTRVYYTLGKLYTYKKRFSEAEKQYKFLYYGLPNLLMPKYMLAMFYHDTNQKNKWEKSASEVISFQPKVKSLLTKNMQDEIRTIVTLNKL